MRLAVCRVIRCDFLLHKRNLDGVTPLQLKTRSLTELRQLIESNVKGNGSTFEVYKCNLGGLTESALVY